jgi:type IV pilus assembly protein PilO
MELQNLPWYGQLLIFLLIGAVLFAIFYFVHYSPTSDEITRIVLESEGLLGEIRKGEMNEAKLKKLEEEKLRNEGILEQLKQILPERKEVSQILRRIQAIISNTRLRMGNFTPGGEKIQNIYSEWPIHISVEGNFHNLGIFFDQISRMAKIFNINSLNIKPMTGMTAEYSIAADFTAATYIYREGVVIKPAAPAAKRPPRRPPAGGDENLSKGDM